MFSTHEKFAVKKIAYFIQSYHSEHIQIRAEQNLLVYGLPPAEDSFTRFRSYSYWKLTIRLIAGELKIII